MAVKSPLKWVGSKARLMPQLLACLPKGKRLVEPFGGSCAVMLNTDYEEYLIGDANPDLVNLWRMMAYHPTPLIREIETLFDAGSVGDKNCRAEFYYVLRERFNQNNGLSSLERAACFLFLNRHCYGGVCRYNQRGHFNTPCGHYEKPFLPKDEIHAFAEKAKQANFICASFEETLQLVTADDVVYCDPPYIPANASANFTQYHTNGFAHYDQEYLAAKLFALSLKGVPVIASNSDTPQTRSIYARFNLTELDAPRSIGARSGGESTAKELLAIR